MAPRADAEIFFSTDDPPAGVNAFITGAAIAGEASAVSAFQTSNPIEVNITGAAILGQAAVVTAAAGGDVFVAKTGSDANSGTEASPFLTIGAGISALGSGQTLIVKSGIYTDDFINGAVASGTSFANATIIKANPGDTVQIKASSPHTTGKRPVLLGSGRSYIVIDGFILGNDNDGERYTHDNIKLVGTSHHIRIQNCEIRYAHNQGWMVVNEASDGSHELLNCEVHHCGSPTRGNQVHGVYISKGKNCKIWDNHIHDNQAFGIQLWFTDTTAVSDNNIQYNRIHGNNVRGGITVRGSDNLIANNIVHDSSGASSGSNSLWQLGGDNNKYISNTIYNNTQNAAYNQGGTNTLFKNNIFFSNGTDDITNVSGSIIDTTNLKVDPTFVNAAINDYHLQSGSAAVGFGTDAAEVIDDKDKVLRGDPPDAGVFEFVP